MNEAWFQRNIERLKEIANTSTPWNVRDQLREYIAKLEEVACALENKKEKLSPDIEKEDIDLSSTLDTMNSY